MIELPFTITNLDRIADALERIALAQESLTFKRVTSIQLNLPGTEEGTMPFTYKADKPDFEFRVKLPGVDSEGNSIPDINIPTGQTLAVTADDALGLVVTQDPLDPKRVMVHVGEPATDESPRPVTVSATLKRDVDGTDVVTPAANSGTITVGDAVGDPTAILIDMPTS